MDVKTILAAAPLVRKAWKFTPPALRLPLLAVGAGVAAWKFFTGDDEHPSVAEHTATVSDRDG